MGKYCFKFFVDHHHDCILWADNEETKQKYGYSPSIQKLPVSKELMVSVDVFGEEISDKFGYIKSLKDYPDLQAKKDDILNRLKTELGPDYQFIDKME